MQKWKLLNSNNIFESKYLTLKKNSYQLPSGKVVDDYYDIARPNYVLIVAHNLNNQIIVEKQYNNVSVKRIKLDKEKYLLHIS